MSLQAMAAVMRRHLLDDISDPVAFSLANQADILFELDSDNSTVTSDVITELGLAVQNGTSSAIPVRLHESLLPTQTLSLMLNNFGDSEKLLGGNDMWPHVSDPRGCPLHMSCIQLGSDVPLHRRQAGKGIQSNVLEGCCAACWRCQLH